MTATHTVQSSILIPVYNQTPDYLRACLRSALRQQAPAGSWEVVVVDDGSEPSCEDVVAEIANEGWAEQPDTFNPPRYLRQANGGVAAALNTALSLADGRYIHWLSSDDLYHPGKVAGQVAAMQAEGALVSYCTYEDGVPQCQQVWPAVQYPTRESLMDALRRHCHINACTVCWEAEFLRGIGGFDVSFRHCQDYEVLLRSATQTNFLAIHEPWVRRRSHPGQMLNTLRQQAEQEIKAQELARLHEMYGATARLWVPT